jgi:hypothetical protein
VIRIGRRRIPGSQAFSRQAAATNQSRACLLPFQIPSFFTLSVTSIFERMHGALNVGKK